MRGRYWLIPVLLLPGIALGMVFAVLAIKYGRGSWQSWVGLGAVALYIGFIHLLGRLWKGAGSEDPAGSGS